MVVLEPEVGGRPQLGRRKTERPWGPRDGSRSPSTGVVVATAHPGDERQHEESRLPLPAPKKCRVLVVEDDRPSREALVAILRRLGHEVAPAATLREGERLLGWGPTCIVLDLMLPDGDGAEILTMIQDRGIRSSVAVVTGIHDAGQLARVRRLGAERIFRKPLDLRGLLDWIEGR